MAGLLDVSKYSGTAQFGRAYRIMLESDAHAPGSVDRLLMSRMIRVCPETEEYLYGKHTPAEVRYPKGSRPELERHVMSVLSGHDSVEKTETGLARFCVGLGENTIGGLDEMILGGTEEDIIRRGSDWCTDVARVGCILFQVSGFPSRMVYLADTNQAYSGHAIIEVYRGRTWGAVDPTSGVVYRDPEGRPASTWDLMSRPEWIDAHQESKSHPYVRAGQFMAAAISNYSVSDRQDYDYTASHINSYCRSILEMSEKGWPGGLRWLHGEDRE